MVFTCAACLCEVKKNKKKKKKQQKKKRNKERIHEEEELKRKKYVRVKEDEYVKVEVVVEEE